MSYYRGSPIWFAEPWELRVRARSKAERAESATSQQPSRHRLPTYWAQFHNPVIKIVSISLVGTNAYLNISLTHEYLKIHRLNKLNITVGQMRFATFPLKRDSCFPCCDADPLPVRESSHHASRPAQNKKGRFLPIILENVKVDWQNYWKSCYFVANWRP